MTTDNGMPAGSNPHFFFDRFPAETAQWVAGLGDEVSAKAGDDGHDFRRIACELIKRNVRDGVPEALGTLDQFVTPSNPGIKWLEQQYRKYDEARAAVIEIKTTTDASPPQPEKSGTAATAQAESGPKAPGQTAGPTGPSTPGAAQAGGSGATITIAGGCGTGRTGNASAGQETGIGHQGTLFTVRYSEFRASVPTRRNKAKEESRRLIGVRRGCDRQIAANDDLLATLDLVEKADSVLVDLVNKHRNESTVSGVLRAAGMSPQELGLTEAAVKWLDTELKVA